MDSSVETPQGDASNSSNALFPKLPDWARTFFASPTFAFVALAALVVLVFGESLNYAMLLYDSERFILEDPAVRVLDWEHVRQVFTTNFEDNYYPFHRLSYMIDHALWGANPAGCRALNFLLHWTAACFVFLFFLELTNRRLVAWATALCFTIHPTRVESVVWLAERKDVLAAAFGFAGLWAYRRGRLTADFGEAGLDRRRAGWYAAALMLIACALASKSQWVPVCAVLVALDLYERQPHIRRRAWQYAPFFAVCALFAWWTYQAQYHLHVEVNRAGTLWMRIGPPLRDVATYVTTTIFPVNLFTRTYPMPIRMWEIVLGALIVASFVALAALGFRQDRTMFFGVAWFFLFVSPMLNLLPGYFVAADRYLYVSMLGLIFPAAMATTRLPLRRAAVIWTTAGILMWGLTWWQVPTWKTDFVLWDNALRKGHPNEFALNNAMISARLAGDTDREQTILEELVALSPEQTSQKFDLAAYKFDLALIRYRKGEYGEAARLFAESLKQKPEYATAPGDCFTVGQAFLMAGRADQARTMFENAVRLDPENVQYWFSLGNAHLKSNNRSEALRCWRKAVEVARDPNLAKAIEAKIAELETSTGN